MSPIATRSGRWKYERGFTVAICAVVALLWLRDQILAFQQWDAVAPQLGNDYRIYTEAAARWLAGGGFYLPFQLSGPYLALPPVVLYPPPSLILFVPFAFLPAILWWVIPLSITVWAVTRHHPRPLAWAGIAVCLWFPTTTAMIWWGNPGMWIVAFLALGTHYGWPAVLILIKPSLAPFALIGIRRRSWWVALAATGFVSLLFLPMWADYVTVLVNLNRGGSGGDYSISSVPTTMIPLLAWLGRLQRHDAEPDVRVAHTGAVLAQRLDAVTEIGSLRPDVIE